MYFVSSVMYDWQNLRVIRFWKSCVLETVTLRQMQAMTTSARTLRQAVLPFAHLSMVQAQPNTEHN